MSYDEKCAELARHFLDEATKERGDLYEAAVADLADDLQDAVEDFLHARLCEKCQALMTGKQAIHSECPRCRGGE